MGEIFRQQESEGELPWTGERLVRGVGGTIEIEHYHRYFIARDLCRDRDVLDVASGEGYGTALLAQTAKSAVGVEIDVEAVQHASAAYTATNLRYIHGNTTSLTLDDASLDVVVSFETLEHFFDHEQFFQETRRVLRTGGLLLVSTPDADVYSGPWSTPNPYHVRELSHAQFGEVLRAHFANVVLLRQRVMIGSAVMADALPDGPGNEPMVYEQRGPLTFESHNQLPRAPYLLAIASDGPLPTIGASVFIQSDDLSAPAAGAQSELERLRAVEVRTIAEAAFVQNAAADASAARAEAARMNDEMVALQAELKRLQAVESRAAEDAGFVQRTAAEASMAKADVAQVSAQMAALQAEFERLQAVEVASREQVESVVRLESELEATRASLQEARAVAQAASDASSAALHEAEALRTRCSAATLLSRQQTLSLARMRHLLTTTLAKQSPAAHIAGDTGISSKSAELTLPPSQQFLRSELDAALSERDRLHEKAEGYARAYEAATRMIIPVWMRRLVPSPLRSASRSIRNVGKPGTLPADAGPAKLASHDS